MYQRKHALRPDGESRLHIFNKRHVARPACRRKHKTAVIRELGERGGHPLCFSTLRKAIQARE